MRANVSGNAFAPVPPELDANGITADEFVTGLFEFSNCDECGKDADQHTVVIGVSGCWFAYCLTEVSQ